MMHFKFEESAFVKKVLDYLLSLDDVQFYLVGGAVRDALLQKSSHDLDFIVRGNSIASARKLADHIQGAFYILDDARNYVRVIGSDEKGSRIVLDFAPLYQDDLIADLRSRDFTINAAAWKVSSKGDDLIDPLDGAGDLEKRILRPCTDRSFLDDPVRVIRTARFAVEYELKFSDMLHEQIHTALPGLSEISEERKRDEFFKILENRRVVNALEILQSLQVIEISLPEVQALVDFPQGSPHQFSGWQHTLKTVQYMESMLNYIDDRKPVPQPLPFFNAIFSLLERFYDGFHRAVEQSMNVNRNSRSLILFASLYHDVGKPQDVGVEMDGRIRYQYHADLGAKAVVKRAKKMALSKMEVQWLECFIKNHMLLHSMDISADKAEQRLFLHRFFCAAGKSSPFVAIFSLADLLATYDTTLTEERWQAGLFRCENALQGWFDEYAVLVDPVPFINGDELQREFQLKPGKRMGILLKDLREAQAAGSVTSRSEAVEWIQTWLNEKKG